MKTRKRIIAAITTLAVAVVGIFAPAENNMGVNTVAEAAVVGADPPTIQLVKMKSNDREVEYYTDKNAGAIVTKDSNGTIVDSSYFENLIENDDFWVRVNIPPLTEAPDTLTVGLQYRTDVFELEKWYNSWDNTTATWDRAGNELHGSAGETGTFPTVDSKTGIIKLSLNTSDTAHLDQFSTSRNYVQAKFSVKEGAAIGGQYSFRFITGDIDDNGEPISWCEASVWDTAAVPKVTKVLWGENYDQTAADANIFYVDPGSDLVKGTTKTAAALKGYINIKGFTFDEYDETQDPVLVRIASSYQWDRSKLTKANEIVDDLVTTNNGYFTFRGVKPNSSYAILIDRWCRYEDPNNAGSWDDQGARITVTQSMLDRRLDPATGKAVTTGSSNIDTVNVIINVRLYGDVNGEYGVDASDATAILRKVVGKTVGKNTSNEDLDTYIQTDEGRLIANILTGTNDYALNARDATHILRYLVNNDSIIKDKEIAIRTAINDRVSATITLP